MLLHRLAICGALAGLLLVAGCATFSRNELAALKARGISHATYGRLERQEKLTLAEIGELSRLGMPDDLLLRHLEMTGAIYELNRARIIALRRKGASEVVIDYLLWRIDHPHSPFGDREGGHSYDYYAPYSYHQLHPYPRVQLRGRRYDRETRPEETRRDVQSRG